MEAKSCHTWRRSRLRLGSGSHLIAHREPRATDPNALNICRPGFPARLVHRVEPVQMADDQTAKLSAARKRIRLELSPSAASIWLPGAGSVAIMPPPWRVALSWPALAVAPEPSGSEIIG